MLVPSYVDLRSGEAWYQTLELLVKSRNRPPPETNLCRSLDVCLKMTLEAYSRSCSSDRELLFFRRIESGARFLIFSIPYQSVAYLWWYFSGALGNCLFSNNSSKHCNRLCFLGQAASISWRYGNPTEGLTSDKSSIPSARYLPF